MDRARLVVIFSLILLSMLAVTTWASFERNVFAAAQDLMSDRWFVATLADAYCGFITFFAWLAWRERHWSSRVGWFVGIMLLGNIAMASYVLRQVWLIRHDFSVERLLLGSARMTDR